MLTLVSQRTHSIMFGVFQCMKLSINITMRQKYLKQLRTTLSVKRTLYLVYLWHSISRYMYLILQGLCKYAFSCIFEQTVKILLWLFSSLRISSGRYLGGVGG